MIRRNLIAAGFLAISLALAAGQVQVITLKDQSVIKGEVLEMKNGTYSIKTATMGELKIAADQIVSMMNEGATPLVAQPASSNTRPSVGGLNIREGNPKAPRVMSKPLIAPPTPEAPTSNAQGQVNERVQSMMMNGQFAEKVTGLSESKDLDSVMADPEVMRAIQNLDYEFLMNNPKMKQLMESGEVKGLLGEGGDSGAGLDLGGE